MNSSDATNSLVEKLIAELNEKLESSKNTIILTSGAHQAAKEIKESYKDFITKKQAEYSEMVSTNKLNAPVANYIIEQLRTVNSYLAEKIRDYDRINHVRQGEAIGLNERITELQKIKEQLTQDSLKRNEIVTLKSPPPPPPPPPSQSSPNPIAEKNGAKNNLPKSPRKRPDEPGTKLGDALQDIKNRRLGTREEVSAGQVQRPGRPKKNVT